ncbi:MAG: DUF4410 domain-containing protein [Burkholderiaceae bacterium]
MEGRLPSVVRDALEEHGLTVSNGSDGRTPGTVAVVVDVKYNPGNRSLRWLAGPFGAGKGSMEVKIEARDAISGAIVATHTDTDTVHAGAFGGDFTKMSKTWWKTSQPTWPKTSLASADDLRPCRIRSGGWARSKKPDR